jgi:curved DNA-binding protein CbpA
VNRQSSIVNRKSSLVARRLRFSFQGESLSNTIYDSRFTTQRNTSMNDERYYQILGLKAGASREEVKAAYRDMAKVWHPDRFLHDPQLQRKAQEKLKEINEAYKELSSPRPARRRAARDPDARARRDAHAARGAYAAHAARARHDAMPTVVIIQQTKARRPSIFPVFAAAAFAAIAFFAASRLLVTKNGAKAAAPDAPVSAASPASASEAYEAEDVSSEGGRKDRKASNRKSSETDAPDGAPDAFASARALPTVTRTVDPTTGLLATRACPSRMLMTYPAGSEPQSYCTADHPSPQAAPRAAEQPARAEGGAPADPQPAAKSKSRLKTVVGALASPGKWLKKKKEKTPEQPKEPS